MKYRVTIGIPVYRSVNYIKKTMESVLEQTFPDIEYLVVDDCGNDGSMEIIKHLKDNHSRGNAIRILKNAQNMGVGYSRNRIIDEARGRYLFFLDSDDFIEPHAIKLLYDSVMYHQAEVSYGSYEIIDCLGYAPTEVFQKSSMVITKDSELAVYVYKNAHIFHVSVCNCLLDLAFLRNTGVRFKNVQFWEDMAFTYDFVPKVGKAVLLSDITYHYLRRGESLSHYQVRDSIEKKEIMKNAAIIDYMKKKCKEHIGKDYLPYLCYNLEICSFYTICHILKHYRFIVPKISCLEMSGMIAHPLCFNEIIGFRKKFLPNMLFWLMGTLPTTVSIPFIWLLGKMKRAI